MSSLEAEKGMAVAQHHFDSSNLENERTALENQLKASHLICKRFYAQCVKTLQRARPGALNQVDVQGSAAQGLGVLLENIFEWLLHHLEVLNTKYENQGKERRELQSFLLQERTVNDANTVSLQSMFSDCICR